MDKVIGSLPYITSFNSHFHDEHTKGHHKYVATLDDPVFPPVGRNIYFAVIHSYIGTHITTWQREAERINRKEPGITFPRMVLQNVIAHCFMLHLTMVIAIYTLFGMEALKF